MQQGPTTKPTRPAKSIDPRPARRQRRFEQILAAAWDVAAEQGLAAVSLHEVARRVGIRQPSLYAYIDSKMALYDAMFGQAAQALLDQMTERAPQQEPREAVREGAHLLAEHAHISPTARQLLFNRTIPGFEPSPAAYAPAVEFYSHWADLLDAAGVTDPSDVDIFTALLGGLLQQQENNEPGGNRYIRHLDTVLDMYFDYIDSHRESKSSAVEEAADRPRQNRSTEPSPTSAP